MLNSEHNYIPQCYGQTDRQTTCSSNTSLCIASRGVAHRYYISLWATEFTQLLPRDAMQSEVLLLQVVCLSVCL